jgi:flagellar basal body-associated protein FliL
LHGCNAEIEEAPQKAPKGVCVIRVVCLFVLFLLAIVLSVFLRFTASDHPTGIFNLFLSEAIRIK